MANETQSETGVLQYVIEGPDAGGNSLLRRILGFYAWWRTWAMMVIMLVGFWVLFNYGPTSGDTRLWGFLIGILTMTAVDQVMGDG